MSDERKRKLGENDPGRYELSFLVGPCTAAEATTLLEDLFDASEGRLGAVGSLTTWDEDDDPLPVAARNTT